MKSISLELTFSNEMDIRVPNCRIYPYLPVINLISLCFADDNLEFPDSRKRNAMQYSENLCTHSNNLER